MQPPAQILEDTDLLAYATVPETARFTGRLKLFTGENRVGAVPNLAIRKPRGEPEIFLVHCDESWDVVGVQGWSTPGVDPITTVEGMKQKAERYYEGLMAAWREVPSADA